MYLTDFVDFFNLVLENTHIYFAKNLLLNV